MKIKSGKRELTYVMFILPAFLLFVVFFFYPVISTLVLAFTDKETMIPEFHFIGLENFKELFTDTPVFYIAIKNNILFTVIVTIMQSLLAFILALALDSRLKGKKFFRTYFFMPVVISSVAISLIWSFMYDPNTGVLNQMALVKKRVDK
jgi:ABC-type sugar transport system permease subunit